VAYAGGRQLLEKFNKILGTSHCIYTIFVLQIFTEAVENKRYIPFVLQFPRESHTKTT
jgi:hypothetical protein